jgi:DNA polymerase elongation subunit (family B)
MVKLQILDWSSCHIKDKDDHNANKFAIRLFGITDDNKRIYLRVDGFKPYFFVEIPKKWKKMHIDMFVNEIKLKVKQNGDLLYSYSVVDKMKFYGFTNNEKYQFIKFTFADTFTYREYEKVFLKKDGHTPRQLYFNNIFENNIQPIDKIYRLFESNFDPILRCMHIRNIKACGWISVDDLFLDEMEDGEESICELNYCTDWNNVIPLNDNNIAKLVIASFDIECTSIDGLFPQAVRPGDKIIQIGTTFSYYGEEECFYKHLITLYSCSKINGAVVESVNTEQEVLVKWKELIEQKNPDILIGYNIFGFDEKYMYDRSALLKCDNFLQLSRLINYTSKLKEKKSETKAFGQNILHYFDSVGRIQVDLYKVIQREYKLQNYKLDYVVSYFINEKISEIVILDIDSDSDENSNSDSDGDDSDDESEKIQDSKFNVIIKTKSNKGLKIDDYIAISYDDGIATNTFGNDDNNKFRVVQLVEGEIRIFVKAELLESLRFLINKKYKKVNWAQVKDDVKPKEIFKLQKGNSKDRARIGKYCLQDCALCNRLITKLQTLTNNIGMANVCHVPLSYIFFRGQSVKGESLVFKKCRVAGYLIRTVYHPRKKEIDPKDERKEVGYQGAYVFEPKKGVYYTPISVLDYSSLYPKSMIHINTSHEFYVDDSKYDNLPNYFYYHRKIENTDGTTEECKFARKMTGERGIIPQILMELLAEREKNKNLMKNEPDPFKKKILDGLQLAYKITANSLYGVIGSRVSKISLRQIAACTTETGKRQLRMAQKIVEENFPGSEVIYGDSVTGDTPVMIKTNKFDIVTIDSLCDKYEKIGDKEYGQVDALIYSDIGWTQIKKVIRHKTKKQIYRIITNTGIVDVTEDHSLLDIKGNKIRPTEVKKGQELLHSFPDQLDLLDEGKMIYTKEGYNYRNRYDVFYKLKSKIAYQKYYYWKRSLGKSMSLNYKKGEYVINEVNEIKNPNTIIKIIPLGETFDYVYDLETENHHFNAGIGCMTVHNTDSIFINFNIKDKDGNILQNKEALQKSIESAQLAATLINDRVPNPHSIVYEKTFWPFCIIAKKKYVGNLYEKDINSFEQKSMGIVLKRRDNSQIVKELVGGIIDKILNQPNKESAMTKSLKFLKEELSNVINRKYKIDKFIITKTLRATYKEKIKKDGTKTEISHKVLADRMGVRDPGNKPQANDRISYAFVRVDKKGVEKKGLSQGHRIEHPDYIKEKKLELDYLFYITNQIQKPSTQFLELLVDDKTINDIFEEAKNKEINRRKKLTSIDNFFKSKDSNVKEQIIKIRPDFVVKETQKKQHKTINNFFKSNKK